MEHTVPEGHGEERRREVEELFHAVVDLPPEERSRRLASSAKDPGILEEVAVMLDLAGKDLGGFLESPAVREARRRGGLEGRRIGPYLVRQLVGEGGFGSVYLAEQERPVRRRVAIKVLKRGLETREVIARFEAERQALALMDHPAIARVLDGGETEDGLPYFVLEYVAGTSIIEYCDSCRLGLKERLRLFLEVTAAIQHAHQKGIIHRDIKPSNILVTSLDGAARPKVIDFGVAKAVSGQRLTEKTLATQLHILVGTPAYMSPEQADLGVADVDTRTDIYALGALLYELLTGRTPLDSGTLQRSGIDEIRRLIREQEPGRPSSALRLLPPDKMRSVAERRTCDPARWISAVKGDLDWIVLKALEKDRTRRYATASDLAADVERFLRFEAVSARPPSRLYLLRKTVRRHRSAFGVAAAILLSLVVGLALTSWQLLRAQRAEEAQRELRIMAENARNEARLRAYAADMKAASIALGEGNLGQVASLLDRYVPQPGEDDIRGMEWRYLRRMSRSDELSSCFQDGIVTHVLLAPGETWAVSGCHQGAVKVWDLQGGKLITSLDAMKGSGGRACLALSPDGRLLLRVRDAAVDLLDTTTWQVVRAIEGKAVSAAFSRDGTRWARVLEDGVHVHESAGPTEIQHLTRPGFKPSQGGLVLDGRKLCLLSPTRRVEVWDLGEARCVSEGLGPNDVHTIALAPGGHRLAAGMSNGNLSLLDLDGLKEIARIPAHPQWLLALAFSPDGKVLASGGGDQCIRLWNVEKDPPDLAKPLGILRGHLNEIWCLAFSANGEQLLSGGKDGAMKLWSARAPEPRSRVLECAPGSLACGFSADGSFFRSLSLSQVFELWRSSDGARAEGFLRPESAVDMKTRRGEWPFFNGDHLFLSLSSGDVEIWSLPRSERLRSIRLELGPVDPVAVDREERLLVAWSHEAKSAGIWSLETGKRLSELSRFWFQSSASPPAVRASFSPDGRWLAYVSPGVAVEIYDVERRVIHHELKAHLMAIYSLGFSPDGKLLATSGGDGSVILWDWASGQRARPPLLGHLAGVLQVTFSGDGRTLISHTGDGSLRCWNVATGTEVLHLPDANAFWCPPISPDGKTLVWRQQSTGKFHMMRLE